MSYQAVIQTGRTLIKDLATLACRFLCFRVQRVEQPICRTVFPTTNTNGLVTVEIGGGLSTTAFSGN
ncbi:MAG: hypothetical protein IPN79_12105 [Saprospiraceae bacterium]|nr:hypothetical protein [Saprospiraceae bacterium]